MKKVLSMLCVLLAFTLVGCDKENDVNGNDQPSGGESSGEGEGGAAAEISEISADASVEMDVDWTNGVIINVTIAPANASMADVAAEVADESIVSVEKEGNGFRVKPKKVGSTTVKIKATRGAASSKTCSVKVNEKGMTTVVEVTKCELVSGDSMDKRTLQDFAQLNGSFKVKLTPSNAKLADDMTWSADKDWVESMGVQGTNYGSGTYGFEIKLKKNASHLSNRTGTMNITFKSKKGNASLKVPITVCGHIYKVEFPVLTSSNSKVENGEVYLNGGESLTITPTISKTGNLLSTDGLEFTTPSSSYGISVSSSYSLSVASSPTSWAPNGVILTCKDKSGAFSTSAMKFHTYAKPMGITIKKAEGEKFYYINGDKVTFVVSISPASARQIWTSTANSAWDVTSETNYTDKLVIQLKGFPGRVDPHSVYVTCKYTNSSNVQPSDHADIYVDEYKSDDVKIGDYVVYNSSTKRFRQMDGGIRALSSSGGTSYRTSKGKEAALNNPGNLGTNEKIVGIVTDACPDTDAKSVADNYDCTLQGFYNIGYKHARMVSLTDGDANRWSDANYSGTDFNNWWNGTSGSQMKGLWGTPPNRVPNCNTPSDEYRFTMGWIEFNKRMSSATPRVKAVYSVENYNTTCPLPAPTTASAGGTTQWLLPAKSFNTRSIKILNEAITYAKGTTLSGEYWTPCYETSNNYSYYLNISSGTYSTAARSNSKKTRPVCWL